MSVEEINEFIKDLKTNTPRLYQLCKIAKVNYTGVKRRLDKDKLTWEDIQRLVDVSSEDSIMELL